MSTTTAKRKRGADTSPDDSFVKKGTRDLGHSTSKAARIVDPRVIAKDLSLLDYNCSCFKDNPVSGWNCIYEGIYK
jgi:hypothetical protein